MNPFLDFMVQLFQQPAIIVGLIALLGLVAQKKPAGDVVTGTVKTILSMLIVAAGAGAVVGGLSPIQDMVNAAMEGKVTTFVAYDELVMASTQTGPVEQIGTAMGLTMLFGFIFHLLLARFTPLHYVYLTGHWIWITTGSWAILFWSFGLNYWTVIALASICSGAWMTISPAIAQPFMRRITGNNDVGMAHGTVLLSALAGAIGLVFGDKEDSTESKQLPDRLSFFRDVAVSTTIVMTIVSIVAAIGAIATRGAAYVESEVTGGQQWVVFAFIAALQFTAGMLVILYGVRMLIGEIVPAFEGISRKIIPNAIPALDVPIIFPFAPNALLIGLIAGLIGEFAGMGVCVALGWPVPIPSIIVAFFACGTAAIFANSTGGRKAAWLGAFIWGFVGWILIAYAFQFEIFGDLVALGAKDLGFSGPDVIAPAIIFDAIGKLFGV
ncbi:PTS ascorbate transporter subunit IIC [Corynebacterium mendelii]|uniref:Ascorbate-specific PTS system EIIC component n=1 Tax=Corynebacterium mendelii TaxID=2765362 RepID=A0A939IXX4_9CORY|nr:PTS ascorbate transporter subunit IIC [Corynebacterium mendelii]MBN9644930.1 PTS ascorbate transporter subunit IIC [Corynebacterium mendelii]